MAPFPTLSRVDVADIYLKHADFEYQARILFDCGSSEKSYPFKRRVNNNFLLSCHHRHCPDCQSARAARWSARFRHLLDRQAAKAQETGSTQPTWVSITLPGVPILTDHVKHEIGTIMGLLKEARAKHFWGSTVRCALAVLNLLPHPGNSQHAAVIPSITIFALLTKQGVTHLNSGAFLKALRKQWPRARGIIPENIPTIDQIFVTDEHERYAASQLVERKIQCWHPHPPGTDAFLELTDQLKGVQQVYTWKLGNIFLKESVIQQDDLGYEKEYTKSRIGEDLPTTLSGLENNSDIPWSQPIPQAIRNLTKVYY